LHRSGDTILKNSDTLSVAEFAREVGIDARTARIAVLSGQIPSKRIGCRDRIPRQILEELRSGNESPRPAA
jgi:hypothetical protein